MLDFFSIADHGALGETSMRIACARMVISVILGLTSSWPVNAWAQTAVTPGPSTPKAGQPEEIIVTANRRSEAIQDVPMSIAAFSAEDLRERGVVELRDVADQVSGVQVFRFVNGQPTWVIRGVGLVETNPNNPPPASVYMDDVYQVTTAQGQMSLFDVGQVEILKGPQGGLYGRNTSSGVVRVTSRMPSLDELQANATVSYGSFERLQVDAGLSIPIVEDRLSVRVSGVSTQGGGWQRSLADNRNWGDADSWALRGVLLAEPAPDSRISLIIAGGRDRSELPLLRAVGARATPEERGAPPQFWCPALNAGFQSDACRTYPGLLRGVGLAPFPLNDPATQSANGDRVLSNAFNRLDIDNVSGVLRGETRLGGLQMSSITGYSNFIYGRAYDGDATSAEFAHQIQRSRFKIFSQEVRVAGETDRMQWSAGLAYNIERLAESSRFLTRDDPFAASVYSGIGVRDDSEAVAILRYNQRSDALAAYAEGDLAFTKEVRLRGSIRYTDLDKSYANGGFFAPLASGPVFPGLRPTTDLQLANSYQLNSPWTGNLTLSWSPKPEFLLYGGIGRGIKEGGFAGGFPLQGAEAIVAFDEEVSTAFEVGAKIDGADGRVRINVAAFYYDYEDAQASVPALSPLTGAVFGRPGNVDARNTGLELDLTVKPVAPLELQASLTYLKAQYTENVLFPTQDGFLATYDGLSRQLAPDLSWTLRAQYETAVSNLGVFRASIDTNGRTERNRPFEAPVGTRREVALFSLSGYQVYNARLSFTSADERWTAAVFGKNLTDEIYIVSPVTDGIASFSNLMGETRSFGISVGFSY